MEVTRLKDETMTITCCNCDTAFTVTHSRYSREKSVKCTNCGADIPLPDKHSLSNRTNEEPDLSHHDRSASTKVLVSWLLTHRCIISGYVCLAIAILFMAISLDGFQIYIPLCLVAVVFGIIVVVDNKPINGLVLILVAIVIVSIFHNYLFKLRHGDEIEEIEQSMKQLEEFFKK